MNRLLVWFGFCRHRHISWPQGREGQVSVVCLDCTRRMNYDWKTMRIGKPEPMGPFAFRILVEVKETKCQDV